MKREEQENLLVDYLLGRLDWEATERLEEMLRSDPSLKTLLIDIQEGLEAEVNALEEGVNPPVEMKSRVMRSLGFESLAEERTENTRSAGRSQGWFTGWLAWSGWGIAAAAVVVSLLQINPGQSGLQKRTDASPAVAIFEIPADSDKKGWRNPMIREVVYADHDDFDSLSEAEIRAEELWSRYVNRRSDDLTQSNGSGFVVIDLVGRQGFAGFYDVKSRDIAQQAQSRQLWLYSAKGKPVEVGDLPAKGDSIEGVYYFSLEGDDLLMDSFESVVPVISGNEIAGL